METLVLTELTWFVTWEDGAVVGWINTSSCWIWLWVKGAPYDCSKELDWLISGWLFLKASKFSWTEAWFIEEPDFLSSKFLNL